MSVLVFMDRSRIPLKTPESYFATVAGIAIPLSAYNEFYRGFFRLRKRFFRHEGEKLGALRGKVLLSRRGLESFRRMEFMGELFSLCRLLHASTFSATRRYLPEDLTLLRYPNLKSSPEALGLDDFCRRDACPILLAYVLERVNSFMLEDHPGQTAALIFKQEAGEGALQISAAVTNLLFNTHYGSGFRGLAGAPMFAPVVHSPGLQTADLCGYIINQHHAERKHYHDLFTEVESMQYISSVQRDEFELKGMNLID
jgi:hypothetical protein